MATMELPTLEHEVRSLFAGQRLEDPYPIWSALRETAPVLRLPAMTLVSRYDTIRSVLEDRARFLAMVSVDNGSRNQAVLAGFSDEGRRVWRQLASDQSRQLNSSDHETHDRLRSIMHRYFSPRVIQGLEAMVQGHVDELLDEAEQAGACNLKPLFSDLAARVIMSIIGGPQDDRDKLADWVHRRAKWFQTENEAHVLDAYAAVEEFKAYVDESIIEPHRQNPGTNPLVSALMSAENEENLTPIEMIENIVGLVSGGTENTSILLSIGMFELLQRREQWEYLCDEPDARSPKAVEELLRFVTPAQWTPRVAREDLELDGVRVSAGETVVTVLAAGNRDPRVYDSPDELLLARDGAPNLSLSHGAKYCLGASVVRLEATLALRELARRFPRMELAIDPADADWSGTNPMVRSIRNVIVTLDTEAA